MTIPNEFIAYLIEFHGRRDYFECHEILEEYWKKVDARNMNSHWVGFILTAVSSYHHRRGNFAGAEKTAKKALKIFESTPESIIHNLGMDYVRLKQIIQLAIQRIQHEEAYQSINLPIKSESLRQVCLSRCEQLGIEWCPKKTDISPDIIHRHLVRDRSDIIREREYQKKLRQAQKTPTVNINTERQ